VERLVQILQMRENKMKIIAFNRFLKTRLTMVGRKILPEVEPTRKSFDVRPGQMKEFLIADSYSSYLELFYTREVFHSLDYIEGRGKVYITFFIYRRKNLIIPKANSVLLKFQFFSMDSKTRIYKYVMNYHDIATFKLLPDPENFFHKV